MQRARADRAQPRDQLLYQAAPDADLPARRLDPDGVEHRRDILPAELAAQQPGEGVAAQRAAAHHADMDKILRMRGCGREPLLEETAAGVARMGAVDGDHPL